MFCRNTLAWKTGGLAGKNGDTQRRPWRRSLPGVRGARQKKSGASHSCIATGSRTRLALCPANPPVLQAKESLKDLGIDNTLESLYLVRPTKRGKITSQRLRENAPRAGESITW